MDKPITTRPVTHKPARSAPKPKPVARLKEEQGYLDGGCNPPPAHRKFHCERP